MDRKRARRAAVGIAVTLGVAACGGKESGTGIDMRGPDAGSVAPGPPPTCDAICAHVIGDCVPGASTTACTADCEATRVHFSGPCPSELDAYLRCMATAGLECKPNDIVIVGCSDARNRLEACTP